MSDAPISSVASLDERGRYLRSLAIDALAGGSRGHIGSTMSLIEILRALYDRVVNVRPHEPNWANRDRVILSKGHGCIAQYVLLADKGFFARSELASFCSYASILGGHPEFGHVPGVEASTGALGHGLSLAVGMAQAARIRNEEHRVFVVLGDGEIDEGSIWEAAISAGHRAFTNLTVIVDYNKLQSYGPTRHVWDLEPMAEKWEAFGFEVSQVDGHDVVQLEEVLVAPARTGPKAVIAHTIKGRGIDFAEDRADWHHRSRISERDVAQLREAIARA